MGKTYNNHSSIRFFRYGANGHMSVLYGNSGWLKPQTVQPRSIQMWGTNLRQSNEKAGGYGKNCDYCVVDPK